MISRKAIATRTKTRHEHKALAEPVAVARERGPSLTLAPYYLRVYLAVHHRLRGFRGEGWAHRVRPTSIALRLTRRCYARCVDCDIW